MTKPLQGTVTPSEFNAYKADNTNYLNLKGSKKSVELSRRKAKRGYTKLILPAVFIGFPNVYTNGFDFKTDFDITTKKNTGGTLHYISPTGIGTNDGLTESTPKLQLGSTLNGCTAGDTIIFLDGNYTLVNLAGAFPAYQKSINLIAKNTGKVNWLCMNVLTYTQHATYPNVYYSARSNVHKVIDIGLIGSGITPQLTLVGTLALCASTEGSYFLENNTTVYVHAYNNAVATSDNTAVLLLSDTFINVTSATSNVNLYLEGINIYGGVNGGNIFFMNSATYLNSVISGKDCNFWYGGASTSSLAANAVTVGGCHSYFVNCKCMYGHKDGFNYVAQNGVIANVFEINCEGGYCGLNYGDDTNQGTTAHNGAHVLRIGDVCYNNHGANIAEAHQDTISVNCGCVCFDSTGVNFNFNFATMDTSTMFLYGCESFGSAKDLYISAGTINIKDTEYSIVEGTPTILS